MNLKRNKAGSFDNILNDHIVHTADIFLPIYCDGHFPEQWTKGVVIPRNYRPITLLSCLSKVFTTIINNRLTTFLESNNKLSEIQSSFRSGYSTADNILVLYLLIDYLKSKGKTVYCTFIDYSNAFDNLWRVGLWRKMLDLGIDGKCLRIIKNIYKDVKSCISLNGELSNFFM